ncbi:hypothetical protein U1Q18_003119 [Sarracenia purpurea var. burkii]
MVLFCWFLWDLLDMDLLSPAGLCNALLVFVLGISLVCCCSARFRAWYAVGWIGVCFAAERCGKYAGSGTIFVPLLQHCDTAIALCYSLSSGHIPCFLLWLQMSILWLLQYLQSLLCMQHLA